MSDAENPNTKRWRLWRDRQLRGESILPLAIDHEFVAMMLAAGKIDDRGSRSKRKLAEAIKRVAIEGCTNALGTSRNAAASGLQVLDLTAAFAAAGGNWKRWWVTPYDSHPNESAHEIAARAIARWITER